jgi:DNA-directed RNA polymerase specialized sigma24 family protein
MIARAVAARCRDVAERWQGSSADRATILSDEFMWDAYAVARERFHRRYRKVQSAPTTYAFHCARSAVTAATRLHVTYRSVTSRLGRVQVQSLESLLRDGVRIEKRFADLWMSTSAPPIGRSMQARLNLAVETLDDFAKMIVKTHIGGTSIDGIASALGCSRQSIHARWKAAITELREALGVEPDEAAKPARKKIVARQN